jgi:hypothetical protein
MELRSRIGVVFLSAVVAMCVMGCEPEQAAGPSSTSADEKGAATDKTAPAKEADDSSASTEAPARSEGGDAAAQPADGGAGNLELVGITFDVPADWQPEEVGTDALAPVAAYTIPAGEGDDGSACTVRITHYPNMAAMPNLVDVNMGRWLRQVQREDGSPSTADDASTWTIEANGVQLTLVDVEGYTAPTMGMGMADANAQAEREPTRMIAAILEHAQGPHFVRAQGKPTEMEARLDEIKQFIISGKAK